MTAAPLFRFNGLLRLLRGLLLGGVCFWAGHCFWPAAPAQPAAAAADSAPVAPAAKPPAPPPPPAQAAPEPAANVGPVHPSWDEARWNQLQAQPASVARNAALAGLLEVLARTDPARALNLAQGETNRLLREQLVQGALKGWGATAPCDAGLWALAQAGQSERSRAVETILASAAAACPEEALRATRLLLQQQPGGSVGYGSTLIDALCNAGRFELAAQFAGGGDSSDRSFWMGEAYSKWAELQPDAAAQAALALNDPAIRSQALHGVVGGWAQADPAGLTAFVAQLPANADRGALVGQALESWVRADPAAAANWINSSDLGADLDQGVKAVASMELDPDSFKPEVALNWAESIQNSRLRSEALDLLLRDWAHLDATAARQYFQTTTNLLPEVRGQLGEIFVQQD